MNPDEVKRREYLGLGALVLGLLNVITGLTCLLFSMPLGLTFLGFGVGITAAGIFVLTKIPDVIGPSENLC